MGRIRNFVLRETIERNKGKNNATWLSFEKREEEITGTDILSQIITDNTIKVTFYDREVLEDNSLGEPINVSQSILFGDRIAIDTALIVCRGTSNQIRLEEYKENGINWVCLLKRGTFLPMGENDITLSEYSNKCEMELRDRFTNDIINKMISSISTRLNELVLSGRLTEEEQEKVIDEIMNLQIMYGMMGELLPTYPRVK